MIGRHELTTELIITKFESQKGLGYLSKMPLHHRPFSDWQMSLDRINDNVDYTTNNTVLEALEFNHRVKWTEQKMQQMPQLMEVIIPYSALKTQVQIAKQEIQRKKNGLNTRLKSQKIVLNDVLHYKCLDCNMIKKEDEFYVSHRTRCKQCRKQRTNTLAGLISVLIDNAAANQSIMEINTDHVLELLLYQQGRSYYTGLPLGLNAGAWQLSLERIDNSIGYVEGNVILENWEFNTMDQSVVCRLDDLITGSAQWSRKKAAQFFSVKFDKDLHKRIPDYYHWRNL